MLLLNLTVITFTFKDVDISLPILFSLMFIVFMIGVKLPMVVQLLELLRKKSAGGKQLQLAPSTAPSF